MAAGCLADAAAGQTAAGGARLGVTLRAAIQRNGGRPLDETWFAPDDLARLAELIPARMSGA